eukprot:12417342-Karenia_brevis.AAC.1
MDLDMELDMELDMNMDRDIDMDMQIVLVSRIIQSGGISSTCVLHLTFKQFNRIFSTNADSTRAGGDKAFGRFV